MSNKITKEQIREKMANSDRWLLVGLITIYKHQTADEQDTRTTNHSNGIGFNGPDSTSLTPIVQFILSRHSEQSIRANQHAKLEQYLDKPWAIEAVRRRMPKYAGQLARLANNKVAE